MIWATSRPDHPYNMCQGRWLQVCSTILIKSRQLWLLWLIQCYFLCYVLLWLIQCCYLCYVLQWLIQCCYLCYVLLELIQCYYLCMYFNGWYNVVICILADIMLLFVFCTSMADMFTCVMYFNDWYNIVTCIISWTYLYIADTMLFNTCVILFDSNHTPTTYWRIKSSRIWWCTAALLCYTHFACFCHSVP